MSSKRLRQAAHEAVQIRSMELAWFFQERLLSFVAGLGCARFMRTRWRSLDTSLNRKICTEKSVMLSV